MCPAREGRKEAIARLRRQQILDAAMEVFSRKGFATARTAEIAGVAGVAEGTIYNYFASKRELFIAAIRNFIITAPLLELIDDLPKRDIYLTFQNVLQNRLKLIESERVSQIPVLMAEILHDPELKALWTKQFIQPFLSKMENIYEKMMKTGKLRRMEPAIVVRSVGGMLLGFLMLKIMEGDASPVNSSPRDEVINTITDLVLHGLLK